jgi:hypothetical protein
MSVQGIASTQNEGDHQEYLAKKQKPGRGHPIVGEILVSIVNDFLFHRKILRGKNK